MGALQCKLRETIWYSWFPIEQRRKPNSPTAAEGTTLAETSSVIVHSTC